MQRAGYVVMVPDPEILQKNAHYWNLPKKAPDCSGPNHSSHAGCLPPQPGCWQGGSNPIWSTSPAQPITHGILTQEIFSRHKAYLLIPQSSPAGDNQYFFSQISLSDLTFRLLHTIQYNIEDPPPYYIQKYTCYYASRWRLSLWWGVGVWQYYHVTMLRWHPSLPLAGHQPMCYINPDMGPLLLSSQPPATLHHLLWEAGQWTRNRAQGWLYGGW